MEVTYYLAAAGLTLASIVGGTYIYLLNPKSIEKLLEVDAFRNVVMYFVGNTEKEKKEDNKIRIGSNGEYTYNGKTYVMPEDFWKHSDFFKQSLLKLESNQIKMHYIDVDIITDDVGIIQLTDKHKKENLPSL